MKKMKLVLETGQEFSGAGYGAGTPAVGEIVFNTSMVGYQEILSDPAYAGQIVVMTYPLIGQYGIMDEDYESKTVGLAGLVVRECCDTPSNFRYTKTLKETLEEHSIPCIAGLDTRMLTKLLRNKGQLRGALVDEEMELDEALKLIGSTKTGVDLVSEVSCKKRWFSRTPQHSFDVVVIDCGIKHSVISALNERGCNVTIVPFNSTMEDILAFNPDGLLISNGPGNPDGHPELVDLIDAMKGKLPIFGICLGTEFIALSYGAKIGRIGCGHHGGHPVRNTKTGKIVTAEHNHCYSIIPESIEGTGLTVAYTDAGDGSIEGIECREDKVFGVMFYPEGGPGPEETKFFDKFVKMMER